MILKNVDRKIYRGSQPITPADWAMLSKAGIRFTLDLQTGANLMTDGIPLDEQLIGDTHGIRVYNNPLPEIGFPSHAQVLMGVDFLDKCGDAGVFVHCKEGVDRTGITVALYRMVRQNWSRDQAVKEMHSEGMHAWYYPWETIL